MFVFLRWFITQPYYLTMYQVVSLGIWYLFFAERFRRPSIWLQASLLILTSVFVWFRFSLTLELFSFGAWLLLGIQLQYLLVHQESAPVSYWLIAPFKWIVTLAEYGPKLLKLISLDRFKAKRLAAEFQLQPINFVLLLRVGGAVMISLPVLLILIMLFWTADPRFAELITKFLELFTFNFNLDWIVDIIEFIKPGWFLLHLLLLGIAFPPLNQLEHHSARSYRFLLEKSILILLISLVFGTFIYVQFQDLGSILTGFRDHTLNPKLYVRSGFYQLLVASSIGLVSAWFAADRLKWVAIKSKFTVMMWLLLLLLLEIVAVSLVAGQRLFAYQWEFGLTSLRIWGGFLLILLWIVCGIIWQKIRQLLSNAQVIEWSIVALSACVVAAGIINVDGLVVRWRPPVVNNQIDASYLANLSPDAFPALDLLIMNKQRQIEKVCRLGQPLFDQLQCFAQLQAAQTEIKLVDLLLANHQVTRPMEIPSKQAEQESWLVCPSGVATPRQGRFSHRPFFDHYFCDYLTRWSDFQTELRDFEAVGYGINRTLRPKVLNIYYLSSPEITEEKVDQLNERLVSMLGTASKYRGGPASLKYQIAQTKVEPTMPPYFTEAYSTGVDELIDYQQIAADHDFCHLVDSGQIDEVWLWMDGHWPGGATILTSGPEFGADNVRLPRCNTTLSVMTFDYTREAELALITMAQRMDYINDYLFNPEQIRVLESGLSNPLDASRQTVGCGTSATPPNTNQAWDYKNQTKVRSVCDSWLNPDQVTEREFDCTEWGCSMQGYTTWWLQQHPGVVRGDQLPEQIDNVWFAFADFDGYLAEKNGK